MAESADKAESTGEVQAVKAAETAPGPTQAVKPERSAVPDAVKSPVPSVAEPVATKAAPDKAATKRAAAPKTAAKRVKKPAAKARSVPGKKPVLANAKVSASRAASKSKPTITELKEKIMATAKTADYNKPFADAVGELQSKTKEAFEKGTAYAGEMTEFAKGNVEALVESGKILSAGAQDMGKSYVADAKSAYETLTADMKEAASVKSPTELFQLQSKIARRNFETLVAYSTQTGEAMMKLYSDAFAPVSNRVSLAAEKISKAA